MSALKELYQELVIDHGRQPRNFGQLENANRIQEGFNPLCGDRLTLYLRENNQVIEKIQFKGSGCAISMASASLMTELLKDKTKAEAQELFRHFHALITANKLEQAEKHLGKLMALSGVSEFPARVKCATLAWHTLIAALENKNEIVSTEEVTS